MVADSRVESWAPVPEMSCAMPKETNQTKQATRIANADSTTLPAVQYAQRGALPMIQTTSGRPTSKARGL